MPDSVTASLASGIRASAA
ncbi:aldehyde-alcohol dehydrogenase domain protein, partial [Yersinia pestis PY-66]